MTLTKRILTMRISEETGLNQVQVFGIIQRTLGHISEALARGDRVELRDFGVFQVKIRQARIGRNPKKPKIGMTIPAHAAVKFKAGKQLRAQVLKLPAPTED